MTVTEQQLRTGPRAQRPPRLRLAMLVVGLLTVLAAGVGIGVRATHGGHAAVDEPQYLLSALSLWEDHDLDISDELADRRFLAFHDADLPVQTAVRPDGSQLSPHDPLLPVLLAVPMGLGGWVAAKLTLAVLAGVLAALLLWVAVRRFAVPPRLAVPGVALATCTAPLAVYGQQVYPELPGALAALVAVAALTAPRPTPRTLTVLALAIVALPWLSVKYTPVGAALYLVAAVGLWRAHRRRAAAVLTGVLAAGGIVYLAAHKAIYGGITVYASGDHFQGSGEFGVVGFHPNYPGRSIRLLGLLVDRDFGIAAWQPAWFLVIPAFVALLLTRPRHWPALAVPLAAGWATATWVALTMQGYWWPGRQLVVVLPLAVLVVLVWLGRVSQLAVDAGGVQAASGKAAESADTGVVSVGFANAAGRRLGVVRRRQSVGRPAPTRAGRAVVVGAAALAVAGVGYYLALVVTGYVSDTTWVLAPDDLALHWPAALLLPDDRDLTTADMVRYAAWVVITVVTALLALRTARRSGRAPAASRTSR